MHDCLITKFNSGLIHLENVQQIEQFLKISKKELDVLSQMTHP